MSQTDEGHVGEQNIATNSQCMSYPTNTQDQQSFEENPIIQSGIQHEKSKVVQTSINFSTAGNLKIETPER